MKLERPLNIAHRGARAHAPENTLHAARLAHKAGADMWELDTCLSKDGHLVVIHDDTLERTTDVAQRPEFSALAFSTEAGNGSTSHKSWRVDAFTLEELRSLDAGTWFGENDPFGTVKAGEVSPAMLASYAKAQIPTLEEALLLTRDLHWQVNVEIKNHYACPGHETVTRQVVDLVKKLGMEDSVVVSSFQHDYLKELVDILPTVPRGALVEQPTKEGDLEKARQYRLAVMESMSFQDVELMCKAASAHFFHPDKAFLTSPELVANIQNAGFGINVWTVNTPEDLQRMIVYGVHGIITDYPQRLHELLK